MQDFALGVSKLENNKAQIFLSPLAFLFVIQSQHMQRAQPTYLTFKHIKVQQ